MILRAEETQVWWAVPSTVDSRLAEILPESERHGARRFRRPADRQRYLAGRVLSRLVLAALTGIDPGRLDIDRRCRNCGEQHGKPVLSNAPEVGFSVSHSGERVAVAVAANARVGVDVESIGAPITDDMAAQLCSPAELGWARQRDSADRTRDLLQMWCRKESVLKATGDGLQAPLSELHLSAPDEPPVVLSWKQHPSLVATARIFDLDAGHGYAAAVTTVDRVIATVVEHQAADLLAGV
jgi:4'-phosphopantetheinyl transferase